MPDTSETADLKGVIQPGADHPSTDERFHADISSQLEQAGILSTPSDVKPAADQAPVVYQDEATGGILSGLPDDLKDQLNREAGRGGTEPSRKFGMIEEIRIKGLNPEGEVRKQ